MSKSTDSDTLASAGELRHDLSVGTSQASDVNLDDASRNEAKENPMRMGTGGSHATAKTASKKRLEWPEWLPLSTSGVDLEKVVSPEWGAVYVRLQTPDEPMDVMIEFDPDSLSARESAFAFAQALIARLQDQRPNRRTRFYSADDHYHVTVFDFDSPEERIASGILESFMTRGVFSGRRHGRGGGTFTHEHETHERQSSWKFTNRRK